MDQNFETYQFWIDIYASTPEIEGNTDHYHLVLIVEGVANANCIFAIDHSPLKTKQPQGKEKNSCQWIVFHLN